MNIRIRLSLLTYLLIHPLLVFSQILYSDSLEMNSRRDAIISALKYQIHEYPASQLKDIYKNFMQDYFGPGHILSDTVAASAYLRRELAEDTPFLGPLYEKTGYEGNFYRVNLSVVKDGIIPYQEFFNAFVESVQGIIPPDKREWLDKWREIESIIDTEGYELYGKETDRNELNDQFIVDNFIVHHSTRFNENYHFHYRIISKDLFKTRILPYLTNQENSQMP